MRRAVGLTLALVVPIGLGLPAVGYWLARHAEPAYSGERELAGLTAPATVRFGRHAVPTIEAASADDAVFAQGYVVARERMWQMDLLRRLAGGRLAEVFGEPALVLDRFYRTMGLPKAARDGVAALPPEVRRLLERYTDGVNAYLTEARGRLPLEYRLAGLTPAPWTPEDSLAIGEYMAWINSVNLREELVFLRIASRLGTRRALALFPTDQGLPAPADGAELPEYAGLVAPVPGLALDAVPPPVAGASNAWAVNGRRSAGAAALLANDPHLAPSVPGIWYELELMAPGLHVAGVALPGVPLVLIGHNEHLAWGMTAAVPDTQDLFLERAAGPGLVRRADGGTEVIATRVEAIPVAGRAEPERLVIRSTRHGVLIDELVAARGANPEGLPAVVVPGRHLAARLTLDQPERALVALWGLATAQTIDDARAAILNLRHAGMNLLVAHRDGAIGWQVSGLLPVRGRGSGAFPVPGDGPGYGWMGFAPLGSNPGLVDPAADKLVSANNRMLPPAEAARLGHAWLPPFRAQRIDEMIDAADAPLAAPDLAAMQQDRASVEARLYLDALRRNLPALRQVDPAAARIAEADLLPWDGRFDGASRSAALFVLLEPALYEALFGDELGGDVRLLMSIAAITYSPLAEALRADAGPFWDDVTTAPVETPAVIWGRALRAAAAGLERTLPDPADQRLDRLRSLTFPHAFDGQPVLGRLFNVGPIGIGGDSATVNVASASPLAPREVGYIPSVRVVYTPADWAATRGTLPLGQSGHRLSPYRTDQLDDWLAGRSHRWPWHGPAAGTAIGELRLRPAAGAPTGVD